MKKTEKTPLREEHNDSPMATLEVRHIDIDWRRKLTSRKLWMAIAAFVSGLIIAAGGSGSTASTVSGCILQGAAVIGYLFAEGLADSSHINDGGE